MTSIDRIRVALTGFPGAPGVWTFYGNDGAALAHHVNALAVSLAAVMPPICRLQTANSGDTINDANGELTGGWTGDTFSQITASGGAEYAGPAGACLTWLTAFVADGHHVKGRTFVVPLQRLSFDSGGGLGSSTVAQLATNAADYVTAAGALAVVWHRPRVARAATAKLKALSAHDGSSHLISGSRVSPKVVVLRSRRD